MKRYVIGTVQLDETSELNWFEQLMLLECDKTLKFKLDTGAHVNVIPLYIFKILNLNDRLKKANIIVSNYGGTVLDVKGSCPLTVISENNIKLSLDFIIVNTKEKSVAVDQSAH